MDETASRSVLLDEPAAVGGLVPHLADGGGAAAPSAIGKLAGGIASLVRYAFGAHALALMDQAVVSGTNFATTILVGRMCGAGELGIYSMGYTFLIGFACVQESLIVLPYTIFRHRPLRGTAEEYAGSVLVQNGLLSIVASIVLAVIATVMHFSGATPGLVSVMWVLTAIMPLSLLREFGRRFAFAHLRVPQALVLDLAVSVVQLMGVAALAASHGLSAAWAYGMLGLAYVVAGVIWLYLTRHSFAICWNQVWPSVRQSIRFGKWFCANQISVMLQGQMIFWVLAWGIGTTATGVYAACLTVLQFSNPVILGLSNTLIAGCALAFSDGGSKELCRVALRNTLLLGAMMGVFCTVMMFAGEDVMRLVYHGGQYQGHRQVIVLLALSLLAFALGIPATHSLIAIERPDVVFKIGLLALVISAVLIPVLVLRWGLVGAAYGTLAGNLIGSVGRWLCFGGLLPREERTPESVVT
ncbi:MAG: lipopolysaccharide biosynthesis protein [Planctomycetia bacterium]|nr:lipopolysaccharide biosynthesis protein [Planctomycetia bacterium]